MSAWKYQASAANNTGGDRPIPPVGSEPAAIVGLIYLGRFIETYPEKKDKQTGQTIPAKSAEVGKLAVCYELTHNKPASGVYILSEMFNLSLKGSLPPNSPFRHLYEKSLGVTLNVDDEIDIETILGKPVLVDVKHKDSKKGNKFAVVDGVSSFPKYIQPNTPTHAPFLWHIGEGKPPHTIPDWVPFLMGQSVQHWASDSIDRGGTGNSKPWLSPSAPAPAAASQADGFGPAPTRQETVGAAAGGSDDDIPF